MMTDGTSTPLWDGAAPGSESWTHDEISTRSSLGFDLVRNVRTPRLTAYIPETGTDRAVLVCPGGAFHFLAIDHEGRAVAELMRTAGLAAFVLTYRVVPTPADDQAFERALVEAFRVGIHEVAAPVLPLAVADAERAIELVRRAGYTHLTMLGFSAGARLTSEVVLRGPRKRADAAGVCYLPSIADCEPGPDAPPLFVLAARDDELGVDGSFTLATAWQRAGLPVEFHLFQRGGHGFGTRATGLPVDRWPELFLAWHASMPG